MPIVTHSAFDSAIYAVPIQKSNYCVEKHRNHKTQYFQLSSATLPRLFNPGLHDVLFSDVTNTDVFTVTVDDRNPEDFFTFEYTFGVVTDGTMAIITERPLRRVDYVDKSTNQVTASGHTSWQFAGRSLVGAAVERGRNTIGYRCNSLRKTPCVKCQGRPHRGFGCLLGS